MFAQQTLLFISLSPEQQLPNGIFVPRAFSNGLHTNSVCSPQWQHLTTPRGVAIKPLRASSVASCHLPPIQFQEWKRCLSSLILKGAIFAGIGKDVRSPLII